MPDFPSKHSSCLKEQLGQIFLPKSSDTIIISEQECIQQLLLINCKVTHSGPSYKYTLTNSFSQVQFQLQKSIETQSSIRCIFL